MKVIKKHLKFIGFYYLVHFGLMFTIGVLAAGASFSDSNTISPFQVLVFKIFNIAAYVLYLPVALIFSEPRPHFPTSFWVLIALTPILYAIVLLLIREMWIRRRRA
ncbi:MAG: hypothetical protein QME63_09275 [Actinomycetota bacterium]|nr:hypothetical protein [Actinomycetota bacterium]